jgi:hypothetical protein
MAGESAVRGVSNEAGNPSGRNQYGRGTIGTAGNNTNDRYYADLTLHEALLGFAFARYEWMVQQPIPKKNNELVRWRKKYRAKGNVYKIKDGGLVSGTSHFRASTGALGTVHDTSGDAIVDSDELESLSLWAGYVELKPIRYASVYRYNPSMLFSDLDDPVEDASSEIGLMLAMQADYQVRSLFDTYGAVLTPRAALTALADADWASTDVLDFEFLCKMETHLRVNGFRPPKGMKKFPMIISAEAAESLILDPDVQSMMRDTAVRADPMAKTLLDGWFGELRCFVLYTSARISDQTLNTGGAAFSGTSGYIFVEDAIGITSLQDDAYAGFLKTSSYLDGAMDVARDPRGAMPQPIQLIHHRPGESGVADELNEKGSVGEKHAIGLTNLYSERVIRFVHAKGSAADRAVIAGGTVGTNV